MVLRVGYTLLLKLSPFYHYSQPLPSCHLLLTPIFNPIKITSLLDRPSPSIGNSKLDLPYNVRRTTYVKGDPIGTDIYDICKYTTRSSKYLRE